MNDLDRLELQAFTKGEADAARALIGRYASKLVNYAAHMIGDYSMAEDLTQEVYIRLWQNADKLSMDENLALRAWLFRVLRNLCLDQLRGRKPHDDDALDQLVDQAPLAEEVLQSRDRAKHAMSLIALLPERQKSALLMAHFEAMSHAEIARSMETTIEAVENLLARARRTLRASALELGAI